MQPLTPDQIAAAEANALANWDRLAAEEREAVTHRPGRLAAEDCAAMAIAPNWRPARPPVTAAESRVLFAFRVAGRPIGARRVSRISGLPLRRVRSLIARLIARGLVTLDGYGPHGGAYFSATR